MALENAIMVCLSEQDLSGYDLAKQFDTSIGFFWHASHPQIYRELRKLKDKGLLESREQVQVGKPNKTLYALTDEGRKALRVWSQQPVAPPSVKDELLVRLYALNTVDNEALKTQLLERKRQHEERLVQYRRIKDTQYSVPDLTRHQTGKLAALEMGIRYEENWVNWCADALKWLD